MNIKKIILKSLFVALLVVGGVESVRAGDASISVKSESGPIPSLAYFWNWSPVVPYGSAGSVNLSQEPSCVGSCEWSPGLRGASASINYAAKLVYKGTNNEISNGASLPVGTEFEVKRVSSLADIHFVGTGYSGDSPYGNWSPNAGPTSVGCMDWNLMEETYSSLWIGTGPAFFFKTTYYTTLGYRAHVLLNVAQPSVSVATVSGPVTCSGDVCKVTNTGEIKVKMNFSSTDGRFYYRYFDQRPDHYGCHANNVPMRKDLGEKDSLGNVHVDSSPYNVSFPTRSITFILTGAPSAQVNGATCGLVDAPSSLTTGQPFIATIRMNNTGSTTWNSASWYHLYKVGSTNWGVTSLYPTGNVAPNTSFQFGSFGFTAPTTTGNHNFSWQMAQLLSPFGPTCTKSINVSAASCTGTLPTNASHYGWSEVLGLAGNTPNVHSATNTPAKCEYFCNTGYTYSGGSCVAIPAPTVTFTASPTSITAGNSSTLTWTVGGNVTSCTASNGWFGGKSVNGGSEPVYPTTDTTYRLSCTGPGGTTVRDAMVTVTPTTNTPPTVNAGSDIEITLPTSSANPSGASATDGDTPLTYLWTRYSAPVGAPGASITGANTLTPTFNNLTTVGVYTYQLLVTDSLGATGGDTMTVTVNSSGGSTASCSAIPPHSSFHAGDDSVTVDTDSVHNDNNTAAKCEFTCNTGYSWDPGSSSCVSTPTASCGAANNVSSTVVPPEANLCSAGTHEWIDNTAGDGSYNWKCNGSGGSSVACSASKTLPSPIMSISVDGPNIIRTGNPVKVVWSVTSPESRQCKVFGGGGISDNFDPSDTSPLPYTSNHVTTPITNTTYFYLRCIDPDGTPHNRSVKVEVIPGPIET